MRLRLPARADQPLLLLAIAIWSGILVVVEPGLGIGGCCAAAALYVRWRSIVLLLLLVGGLTAGIGSGLLVSERHHALYTAVEPMTRVEAVLVATTDLQKGRFEDVVVARAVQVSDGALPSGQLALSGQDLEGIQVGDRVRIRGFFAPGVARIGRKQVVGRIAVHSFATEPGGVALHLRAANALRDRVDAVVRPQSSPGRALLAGFLVGDTSGVSPTELDNMRRSGLSHFVAVSGSNVALFLMMWWILLAPLASAGWLRAVAGVVGLMVFAAMTRWEPSVIRAATAAAVLMLARAAGIPLSGWGTLGATVSIVLLVAGELASDVGFQLSVFAVVGVMGGSNIVNFRPTIVATGLSASVSAQLLVSPVLLSTFGTIPALSPLANVLAGPLVMGATSLAGVGVVSGFGPLVGLAAWVADGVLAIARVGAGWPQLSAIGFIAAAFSVALVAIFARSLLVPLLMVAVVVAVWPGADRPSDLPAAVFLDVGQGDSTLFLGDTMTVLIDGGPDPTLLERHLARYEVRRIDVLVVSHVHADHILGLAAVLGRIPVGTIIAEFSHHSTPAAQWLLGEADRLGIPVVAPEVGDRFGSAQLDFEILAPLRRYASPNDESVVVRVTIAGLDILMSGDIEAYAQRELELRGVDVLKVPHQGAATSDLAWISRHAGALAVVSVGANSFGHPSEEVIDTLSAAGAKVHRTDRDGDLVIGSD